MVDTPPFIIEDQPIHLGQSRSVELQFGESYLGKPVSVPVHVIRAPAPGPAVCLTGVIHGDELNGMGIVRELAYNTPPALRKGTLVCVPVVNIYGLERHARYMPDRRDLNRCFPGSPSGSLARRLAHAVFSKIIRQCDCGIDFHSAAIRRTNYPNVRANLGDPATRRIAEAFGCELIVHSAGPKGSLRRAAAEAGVPIIILEAGEIWKIEPGVVAVGIRGCLNVLKSLEMIHGQPEPPAFRVAVKKTTWVRAEQGGLLTFHASPGQLVSKGDCLATCSSIFGREQSPMIAPVNGIVLGMTTMPAIKPGEPVYNIAVLSKRVCEKTRPLLERRSAKSPYSRVQEDLATNVLVQDP